MAYKTDINRERVKIKAKQVKEITEKLKKYKTVALLELTKLPDSLLQLLRRDIRKNGGEVIVAKKAVVTRVLGTDKKLAAKTNECNRPVALILTNQSPYELNTFFKQKKKKRAAKVGDVAITDIVVPEGETDLPPGPALSELKAGGISVQIKGGKIVVNRDSTVAKAGEKLSTPKVKALQSLGIMPFDVTARMIFGYDGEYVYSKELLDIGDTIEEDIAEGFEQGMNLSLNIGYPTEENIEILLKNAMKQAMNVSLNGDLYSTSSIEWLLASATKQGLALEGLENKEVKK